MRLIDAEWLKELYKPYASFNGKEYSVPIGAILANIDDAPSIEIIRCRECKYFNEEYGSCHAYHWDLNQGLEYPEVDADDFCSYGEERSE